MRIIGFNFTKIFAERSKDFEPGPINTNIEFTDLGKEKVELLREGEAIKASFRFSISYLDKAMENDKKEKNAKAGKKYGETVFEGNIILSADKEESKELTKHWKKKDLPNAFKVPLFNAILKKCSARALSLEEDVNLPPHIPIPKIQLQKQQPQN